MDETGIFDILNTSLIFWEVIAFFILLFLLVRYVYPPIREQIKREAREEGDRIIQRAREEIDRERESALREIRREVADMVVQASEQVIGRSIDRDEHERLISQALDDLEAEVAGSRTA